MRRCVRCCTKLESVDISNCPKCKAIGFWFNLPERCDVCKDFYEELDVHHIDGNHYNNIYKNKIKLCRRCHNLIHKGEGKHPGRISHVNKLGYIGYLNFSYYRELLLRAKYKSDVEKQLKEAIWL